MNGVVTAVLGPDLVRLRLADDSTPTVRVDRAVAAAVAPGTVDHLATPPAPAWFSLVTSTLPAPAPPRRVPTLPCSHSLAEWGKHWSPSGAAEIRCPCRHSLAEWGYEHWRASGVVEIRCRRCLLDRVNWRAREKRRRTRARGGLTVAAPSRR